MVDDLLQDAGRRMDRSVESTREKFNTVRTGRASAALLDRIQIDYYGQKTPLKQLATINVPEPRMLTIQAFDPSSIKSIEKAIQESDLGLTPSNDGKVIRLPIPQLTEERRKELVRVVRELAEEGKVAVRNVRRDAIHHLKEAVNKGQIGDDDERRAEERVQKPSPWRSSWTATAAGPGSMASRRRRATAKAPARCAGQSRRRSTWVCGRLPSTPFRPKTGHGPRTRSTT